MCVCFHIYICFREGKKTSLEKAKHFSECSGSTGLTHSGLLYLCPSFHSKPHALNVQDPGIAVVSLNP